MNPELKDLADALEARAVELEAAAENWRRHASQLEAAAAELRRAVPMGVAAGYAFAMLPQGQSVSRDPTGRLLYDPPRYPLRTP